MKRRRLVKLLLGSIVTVVATSCSTKTTVDTSMFDPVAASTPKSNPVATATQKGNLPTCPGWSNAISADNIADIPKIQKLGYEVSHCKRSISEGDSSVIEVVLVKVQDVATTDTEFAEKQVQYQDSAIANLKKNGVSAKSAGVG